ncbi:DUF2330 domain-containing protein [bacterium]|nr:DUF2330 domain-containing protein [bacterium]
MHKRIWLLLFLCATALPDGVVFYPYDNLPRIFSRADQQAFIYYEGGQEILILSIKYRGDASDFAWIIPVPSKPRVAKAPEDFFEQVQDLLHYLGYGRKPGELLAPSGFDGFGGHLGESEPVTVISRQTIGIYDVAVLSSTDPQALSNWCKKEGYKLPDSAPSILKTYIDRKWFFIAVKIDKKAFGKATIGAGDLTPIMIGFTSNKIIYPLKISFLNREHLRPNIKKIDEWAGHPVIFREEEEELIDKLIEQLEKERREGKNLEETLLYKLGFEDSIKPSPFDDFTRRERIIRSTLESEFRQIAQKENCNLELVVVAPYFVDIAEETPKAIRDNLSIPFTSHLKPDLFYKYLTYQDKRPIFKPKQTMALTYISGEVPYALFIDDLFLTPHWGGKSEIKPN